MTTEQWVVAPVVDGRAVWGTVRTVCAVCGARNQPTLAARLATLQTRLDRLLADLEHARAERDTARARAERATADRDAARAEVRRLREQLTRERQVVADGLAWLLDLPVIRRGHVEQLRRVWFGGES